MNAIGQHLKNALVPAQQSPAEAEMEVDGDEESHRERIAVIAEVEDSAGYVAQHTTEPTEEAEAVVFEEPIDLTEYDEFTLSTVVQRRLAALNDPAFRVAASKESSVLPSIAALTDAINFVEDEQEIVLAEQMKQNLASLKMQEAMDGVDGLNIEKPESEGGVAARGKVMQSWADITLLPVSEFEELRPRMALTYPFELDGFQKQAVMRLERHEHVFVAAHTSAGKTVVAEYAIAMALKNGSRAVYTSPIKALSNQKYRDFKERFGVDNVGIVTGDVSVNPQAQCLIMTTEIFRSMLYKGADTVRDIEYVIFDEVHYVNDAERGVVWEEVIIMLPENICLIFLSATTPNAVDFSDWIGRTKRKKVYLTSTNKRPVPLQHFMFFEDEVFKLMQGDKTYNAGAMAAAAKHLKDKSQPKPMTAQNAQFAAQRQQEKVTNAAQKAGRDPKQQQKVMQQVLNKSYKPGAAGAGGSGGAGKGKGNAVGGSRGQWISLLNILQAGGREQKGGQGAIDFGVATNNRTVFLKKVARQEKDDMIPYEQLPNYLRQAMSKKEYEGIEVRASEFEPEVVGNEIGLLPVVIFSFSKKKCEELGDYFKSLDLLTNRERGRVQQVVAGVLQRLSPADAELPQINRLRDALSRGVGVHHSGLLPILKELVEILFAQNLVKVLLATETFAMGVNMPARCVVFNGYRKHDGRNFRDLFPGEYIQMAGRAGRRGLDKVGTVIVANWGDLPTEINIKKLLTGQPTLLSSQFRLRYNMILNLIRADTLSVEDMMKKSFTEFSAQKALASHDLTFKRKKYELLLEYYQELQSQFDNGSSEEITQYVHYFQTCQELLLEELLLIEKILAGSKQPNSIDVVFCPGRALQIQNARTGKPVHALVLASPATVTKFTTESVSEPTTPVQGSSMAAARAALMGGSTKIPSATPKVGTDAAKIYVLAMLDAADLPSWCFVGEENQPRELNTVLLTSYETIFGHFPQEGGAIGYYSLQQISVKDVGVVYDSIVQLRGVPHEVDIPDALRAVAKLAAKEVSQPLNIMSLQKSVVSGDLDVGDVQHRWLYYANLVVQEFLPQSYPHLTHQYLYLLKIRKVNKKLEIIQHAISSASISLFPEFRQRRNVLQQLGYVQAMEASQFSVTIFDAAQQNDQHVITKKGRVCCELNSCEELLGTEMLFHNVLEPLNPPEIAGILSAFVFQEKNDVEEVLTSRMEVARTQLMEIFHQLNSLQQLEKIEVDPDVTGGKPVLNFGLCSVVYQWARGVALKDIMNITSFQEGSIVRAITRLDELCRDIQKAAKVMGNVSLYYKMEAVSVCIKRDIVFAASLYIA